MFSDRVSFINWFECMRFFYYYVYGVLMLSRSDNNEIGMEMLEGCG